MWSIIHTLCNVECAFVLSKWLELIASHSESLSANEQSLLGMVESVLSETSFKPTIDARSLSPKRIKGIGVAIIKLLAQTLKGVHVFELVEVLCISLENYAAILEKEL
jgi:hypothetical protein